VLFRTEQLQQQNKPSARRSDLLARALRVIDTKEISLIYIPS